MADENDDYYSDYIHYKDKCSELQNQLDREERTHKREIQDLESEKDDLEREVKNLERKIEDQEREISDLEYRLRCAENDRRYHQ